MLQTAAVDGGQAPGTFAGGQQLLLGSAVMADPTHGVLWHSTEEHKSNRRNSDLVVQISLLHVH